jgi:hypothetical protein
MNANIFEASPTQFFDGLHTQAQAANLPLKLTSELKQTANISRFSNDNIKQRTLELTQQAEITDCMLARNGEEAAACSHRSLNLSFLLLDKRNI